MIIETTRDSGTGFQWEMANNCTEKVIIGRHIRLSAIIACASTSGAQTGNDLIVVNVQTVDRTSLRHSFLLQKRPH